MFIAHKHTRIVKFMAVFIALIAVGVGGWVYFQPTTNAANLKNFDPGNIISDSVMSNKNSMSVAQIQSFLDSKNACNNTNTYMAGWYPNLKYTIKNGKFACMAQDTFNGKSAAQIIWQVGQDYSINPQALLVLLEKEQGLVSDTWPNNTQYNTATGFGCPDTAACDSKYFGLENQLRQAASLFRTVMDGGWTNYPVGSTYVQYNPNAACGGTVVNIQNRATSALYRYTPYQPNQSALNAGYGTGDGCGAYGNRNFWLFFTDWFGSTQGFDIKGSIKIKYDSLNGSETLGLPLYNERNDGNGIWWQCFEKGCIIGRSTTGYWESKGSIREKWVELGLQGGALGLPISGESYNSTTNTWEQTYEGGKIVTYSGRIDKYAIKGSIYKAYDTYGKDLLNLPTSDESTDNKGVWWQKFDGNSAIIGRSATGYWESKGSIRIVWAETGYQDGALGLPIGNEISSPGSCYSQKYEKGTISGCNGSYAYKLNSDDQVSD